jgi:SAM-dependent methyltransferase
MAHTQQLEFVRVTKTLFPEMFSGKRVLEIGSLDINGSVRSYFTQCDYIGLDIGPGPGVDVVCQGQEYDAPNDSFDVTVCCEVMEHNPFWQDTLRNMIRLLKPGGLLIMSCATTGRPEHGTTRTDTLSSPLTVGKGWEYYRNLRAKDVVAEVNLSELSSFAFATNLESWDLYMLGLRKGADAAKAAQIEQFKAIYRKRTLQAFARRAAFSVRNPTRVKNFLKRMLSSTGNRAKAV